jgi:hypothetical protein
MNSEYVNILNQLVNAGGSLRSFDITGDDEKKVIHQLEVLRYVEFYDDWNYYPGDSVDSYRITEMGRKYLHDNSEPPH